MNSTKQTMLALRRTAEEIHRLNAVFKPPVDVAAMPHAELQKLVHELSVHQIELEMQNEELRKTYSELARSRERYFDLYDMAPVGYFTLDAQGTILECNLTAAALLGTERNALVSKAITSLIEAHDQDAYYHFRRGFTSAEQSHSIELRLYKVDGTHFWAQLDATSRLDNAGSLQLRLSFVDVSQRRAADDWLRVAAIAFESTTGMFVTDANHFILRVNTAFSDISGYTQKDALGRHADFVHASSAPGGVYDTILERVAHSGSWRGEVQLKRKSGEIFPGWMGLTTVMNKAGEISHYVGTMADITVRKKAECDINLLAFYDPLTGLPNRRLLTDRMSKAQATALRFDRRGALLFIDLDNFKSINDTLGHDKGDVLLVKVAQRLTDSMREGDTVARFGGDEFVVLLENLGVEPGLAAFQAEVVAQKLIEVLHQPYLISNRPHYSSVSIGITLLGERAEAVEESLKRADLAMYQAKAAGKNRLCFFDPKTQARVTARSETEAGLRHALAHSELLLHYQPQVVGEQYVLGVEALVRWQHPQKGMVSPLDFISVAEESGLIVPVGAWVLQQACTQLVAWSQNPAFATLTIAVNVSPRQFQQPDFVEQVLTVLQTTGANPKLLKLELTESLLVDNVDDTIAKIKRMRAVGIGFALDDFGTGFSSLSYLKRLPMDVIKIDRTFVKDILEDANDAAIAKMLIALAETLGLQVIAEGVETHAQREFLQELGCSAYQGYLFSKPLPVAEFEAQMALKWRPASPLLAA